MTQLNHIKPTDIFALVVGIEKYQGHRDLDGPASDARKFSNWLLAKGVPVENISLYLSVLSQNQALLDSNQPSAKAPLSYEIQNEILNSLSLRRESLFIFYWGGHGVIKIDGQRKLFCADTTLANLVNLDFDSLLVSLRSNFFRGFEHQILIVDACADYLEKIVTAASLPLQEFPAGDPVGKRDQFAIFASRPGESAQNISGSKTGLFSEVLRELLEKSGDFPPDMPGLTLRLQEKFTELREMGNVYQTPAYFWYRDANGSQGTLAQTSNKGARRAAQRRIFTAQEKRQLMTALLQCPSVSIPESRETILLQLRSSIYHSIRRSSASNIEVFNIVDTCLRYVGGINELIEAVRVFDEEQAAVSDLLELAQRLKLF